MTKGIMVLSLFDGISCGRIALDRLGIKVSQYFASEIEPSAIKVSKANWQDVVHIGDVTKVSYKDGWLQTEFGEHFVGRVDLLLAGSPCQGFSLAGKQLAFDDPRSKLYFEFERLLQETGAKHFLLENVKMKQEHKDTITERLGVKPVAINSALVSAQNRYRLYWTNIWDVPQPQDLGVKLADVLEENVDDKYFIKGGRLDWLKKCGEVKEAGGYVAFSPNKAKCLTVRPEPSWNCTYIVGAAQRGRYNEDGSTSQHIEYRQDDKANCLLTSYKNSLVGTVQRGRGTNEGGMRAVNGKTPTVTTSSWEHNNFVVHGAAFRNQIVKGRQEAQLNVRKDGKANCVVASYANKLNCVFEAGLVRKLTPTECETLQTVPKGYTSCISDNKRYAALGNGWTVDVICHILSPLKGQYD